MLKEKYLKHNSSTETRTYDNDYSKKEIPSYENNFSKNETISTEKQFSVKGWNGTKYQLTAKQLYERVLADSQSDYNWIASATELVRVCNDPDFPIEYAKKIKLLILNCFANLELKKEYESHGKSTDSEAVYFCYNSLDSTNKEVSTVKEKYLTAIIKSVIKYDTDSVRLPIYSGPKYHELCEKWQKEKFHEYASQKSIDFKQLRKDLYKDFGCTIKKASDEGILTNTDIVYKVDDIDIKIICK